MENNSDANETRNREEDLEPVSRLAGRGSRTMGPERHEISCSKRTQQTMRTTPYTNPTFAEDGGKIEKKTSCTYPLFSHLA
jgi:hypothetical protein